MIIITSALQKILQDINKLLNILTMLLYHLEEEKPPEFKSWHLHPLYTSLRWIKKSNHACIT